MQELLHDDCKEVGEYSMGIQKDCIKIEIEHHAHLYTRIADCINSN